MAHVVSASRSAGFPACSRPMPQHGAAKASGPRSRGRAPFRVPLACRCCRTTQPLDAPAARESHRVVPTSSHVTSGGLASIYSKKKMLVAGTTDRSFGLEWARLGSLSTRCLRYRGTELLHSYSGTKPHWHARGEMPLVPSSAIFVDNIPSRRPKRNSHQRSVPLLLISCPLASAA